MIYAGDVDFICNWLGNKAWTLDLEWDGKAQVGREENEREETRRDEKRREETRREETRREEKRRGGNRVTLVASLLLVVVFVLKHIQRVDLTKTTTE